MIIKILQFVLSFSLLVIIHELGHFLFARMFKVKVEKFYLFFNPWFSLFKFNYKGTEYGIGWIPFGGYVKIAGMVDESMDKEQMKQPPKEYEFRTKPAYQRLLIMTGGVMMNLLLAMCIYIGITFSWGENYISNSKLTNGSVFSPLAQEIGFRNGDRIISVDGDTIEDYDMVYMAMVMNTAERVDVIRDNKPVTININHSFLPRMLEEREFMSPRFPFIVAQVTQGSNAEKAGVKAEDRFIAINGIPMLYYDEYQAELQKHKGQQVAIAVMRNQATVADTLMVAVTDSAKIGLIAHSIDLLPLSEHKYSLMQSIPKGIKRTGTEVSNYWKQLKLIFSPKTEGYKSVGGVMTMASIFPEVWSWYVFWRITALLSIVLAVMNILPIPMLDGGHVMFVLYEMITGKKPSDKFMEIAITIGLVIIVGLFILANMNDVNRFFIK